MKIEQYDSVEEKWFSYYVKELLNAGWLLNAKYQPKSVEITPEQFVHAYVKKRDTNEIKQIKLVNSLSYTADWELVWNKKAEGVFYWQEGGIYPRNFYPYSKARAGHFIPFFASGQVSIVDIKGAVIGRSNTSAITFPLKQKFLLKDGTFVQKIVVSLSEKGIFARTFFPRQVVIDEVYKRDCKFGKEGESKIKVPVRLLEQWIKKT